MQCTLTIPITTRADVTAQQVATLVQNLIDIGLADAAATIAAGEGDLASAELATDLNIAAPIVATDTDEPAQLSPNTDDRAGPRTDSLTALDDVPIGTPGRLVTADGRPVNHTLESLSGSCGIVEAIRSSDGSLRLTFDGYTQVWWDGQTTVTRGGYPVFLDEDGSEVHGSSVRLARL